MNTKRSSQEELVDIPLLEEESGDSGIVDGKVDLECDVEVVSSLPQTPIFPVTAPAKESRLTILLQVCIL